MPHFAGDALEACNACHQFSPLDCLVCGAFRGQLGQREFLAQFVHGFCVGQRFGVAPILLLAAVQCLVAAIDF